MKILFLRNEMCESWEKALFELNLALSELGLKEEIEEKVIKTQSEAERHKFLGSPTIFINGKDVDATSEQAKDVAFSTCRVYLYRGKFYEYPPKEMIIHALDHQIK